MIRTLALILLVITLGTSQAAAQADDLDRLKSGLLAQGWKSDRGWLEGQIARVFPEGGDECVVFFSEELGGFVSFGGLDSLRVRIQLPDSSQPSGQSDHRYYWMELVPRTLWDRQVKRLPSCSHLQHRQ
jgi:hypothetical protein